VRIRVLLPAAKFAGSYDSFRFTQVLWTCSQLSMGSTIVSLFNPNHSIAVSAADVW